MNEFILLYTAGMSLRPLSILFFLICSSSFFQSFAASKEDVLLPKRLVQKELTQKEMESEKRTDDSTPRKHILQELSVSPAQELSSTSTDDHQEDLYLYRQSFSFNLGARADTDSETDFLAGFNYLLPSDSHHHFEVGADVFEGGEGALHFGYLSFWRKFRRFRPYLKAALALHLDGEDQLAEFIDFEQLRIRGAAGFESLLISPLSYRIEADISLGQSPQYGALRFGLSWAWY